MANFLNIHVNNPCTEDWDNMNEQDYGRFCSTCSKTVIDFTSWSDEQLLNFFKDNTNHICGRFHTDQVDRNIPLPAKKYSFLKYFFQISIPALLFGLKTGAQDIVNKKPAIHFCDKKSKPLTIEGIVLNTEGIPIPAASVMIEGTNRGVAADSNGIFRIALGSNDRSLQISSVGYETKLVSVTGSNMEVRLNTVTIENILIKSAYTKRKYCTAVMGAIGSQRVYSKHPVINLAGFSSQPFNSDIQIFPNPVKRNSSITLRWKSPVNNDQQLRLYNETGSLILVNKIKGIKNRTQEQLQLSLNTAGFYFLQVEDLKSGNKKLLRIVVE